MSPPAVDLPLLDFAVTLANQAGKLAAERFFATDFETSIKGDGTEVTDADGRRASDPQPTAPR